MRKTLAVVATTGIVLLAPATSAFAAPPEAVGVAQTTATVDDEGDRTGLWGLLGLLGLAGLIKRRETDTTDRR